MQPSQKELLQCHSPLKHLAVRDEEDFEGMEFYSNESYVVFLNLYVPIALAHAIILTIRVNLPSYALQPETAPPWEPISAALTRGPEMDPCSRSRLVERTTVGEGR